MARVRTAKYPKPAEIEPEFESQELPDDEPVFPLETGGFASATKAEAVRIALSEGLESPGDIQEFIQAKFGHDIPKPTISSYKSQQNARVAKKKRPVFEPTPEPEPVGKSMNKSEAARAAIDAGHDKPADAVDYIQRTFGI